MPTAWLHLYIWMSERFNTLILQMPFWAELCGGAEVKAIYVEGRSLAWKQEPRIPVLLMWVYSTFTQFPPCQVVEGERLSQRSWLQAAERTLVKLSKGEFTMRLLKDQNQGRLEHLTQTQPDRTPGSPATGNPGNTLILQALSRRLLLPLQPPTKPT